MKTSEPLPADSIASRHQHYGKRGASALGLSSLGYVSRPATRKVEPADCKSEPVKECEEVPTTIKRSVLSWLWSEVYCVFTLSVTSPGYSKSRLLFKARMSVLGPFGPQLG